MFKQILEYVKTYHFEMKVLAIALPIVIALGVGLLAGGNIHQALGFAHRR